MWESGIWTLIVTRKVKNPIKLSSYSPDGVAAPLPVNPLIFTDERISVFNVIIYTYLNTLVYKRCKTK